jgi:hypothetical protein
VQAQRTAEIRLNQVVLGKGRESSDNAEKVIACTFHGTRPAAVRLREVVLDHPELGRRCGER